MKEFVHKLMTHRYLPVMVALLAVVLTLPSLTVGWLGDDYWHRLFFCGKDIGLDQTMNPTEYPLDIFRFMTGDPEHIAKLREIGIPWWTYEKVRGAFWRPVTAVTHWLDYQLWPENPVWMHGQSVLWYGLLALVVAIYYRRLMGVTWAAGLAGLLYAIDDARGTPVGFLANRNILICAFFGILALIAHDRWRHGGKHRWAVVAVLLLLVSLLAKESGISVCAYLIAYALFIDSGSWRGRAASLAPYLVVIIVWRLVWTELGYGVYGLGGYVDPLQDPVHFIQALITRAPVLLLGQWALPPADVYIIAGVNRAALIIGALIVMVLVGIGLIPLLQLNRISRFWLTGMILSVVPICSTFPSDRMLIFVGIGAMGLLGQFICSVWGRDKIQINNFLHRWLVVVLGVIFILIHLVEAPPVLMHRSANPFGSRKLIHAYMVDVEMDKSVEQQDVIVVNPPVPLMVAYMPVMRAFAGEPVPRRVRTLSSGGTDVQVYRRGEKCLVVRPRGGYFTFYFDKLFRNEQHPLKLNEKIMMNGMTAEVTEITDDKRPAEAAFYFDVPLEDKSLRWLQWKEGKFVPFVPPPVGEQAELRFK